LFDPGALGGMFLGIFLLGAVYTALGCFASALTRSQIVAAMVSFMIGLSLFILNYIADKFPLEKNWVTDVLNYVSMTEHMQDFSRGVVDTRYVVYYVALAAFFLFLTLRVVESRRWK
jgi:ABC-2 type transport system permease protein